MRVSWGLFVVAVVSSGLALCSLYGGGLHVRNDEDAGHWSMYLHISSWLLFFAGTTFVVGLVLVLVAGLLPEREHDAPRAIAERTDS